MLETYWDCPLCGSDASHQDHFDYVNDRILTSEGYMPIPIYYVLCNICGMVFQRMGLSDDGQKLFYEATYRATIQGGTDEVTDRAKEEQESRAIKLMAEVFLPKKENPKYKKALDVGASAGHLLKKLQEHERIEKGYGIEPGKAFRDFTVKEQGFTCYPELSKLPGDRKYDLITMIHTLEHVTYPRDTLTNLAQKYAEDGCTLVIEVPDLYYEWSCKRLSHPVIFTPHTLEQTIKSSGWDIVELYNYPGIKKEKENILAVCTLAGDIQSVEFTNETDLDLYDELTAKYERMMGR